MGSRSCGEERKREEEEDEMEKTVLDKIKRLRRLAGKRSSRGGRGWTSNQPAAKKRKIDESNKFEATNVAAVMPVNEEVGEKRKSENVDEN